MPNNAAPAEPGNRPEPNAVQSQGRREYSVIAVSDAVHPWFDAEDFEVTFAGSEHWVAVAYDGAEDYLLSLDGPWEVVRHQGRPRARVINIHTFELARASVNLHSLLTKTNGVWYPVEVPQAVVQQWIAKAKEEYQQNPPRISRAYQRMLQVQEQAQESFDHLPNDLPDIERTRFNLVITCASL